MEEVCRIQSKQTLLTICHTLTENNSKIFGWHWLQVTVWEGSQQKGTTKTDEHGQLKRPTVTAISFLQSGHNLGVPNGWQRKNQHPHHIKTIGEVQKPHGHHIGIQGIHRNGVIIHSEGALPGERKFTGENKHRIQTSVTGHKGLCSGYTTCLIASHTYTQAKNGI